MHPISKSHPVDIMECNQDQSIRDNTVLIRTINCRSPTQATMASWKIPWHLVDLFFPFCLFTTYSVYRMSIIYRSHIPSTVYQYHLTHPFIQCVPFVIKPRHQSWNLATDLSPGVFFFLAGCECCWRMVIRRPLCAEQNNHIHGSAILRSR